MFDTIKVARPFTYADDTKLLMAMHDSFDNVSLQEDLNQVFLWSNQWDLLLNPAIFTTILVSPHLINTILFMIILSLLTMTSRIWASPTPLVFNGTSIIRI